SLDDASLEPCDCHQLWKTMIKYQTDTYRVKKELTLEFALPELVEKSDTINWGSALKKQLVPDVISPTSLSLLVDLRSRGALHAILFNYDRVGCEKILFKLLQLLQNAEQKHRDTSHKWAEKMTAYNEWMKERESNAARKGAKSLRNNGTAMTQADLAQDGANRETSPWENFDPESPLPQFSFADTTKITNGELEEKIRSLDGQGMRPPFIHALHRGLAVHHAGMNRQYRQV
ncbi:hypothetical protein LX36DRAFT_592219, partial [Colletotrichum falcatum]